MKKLLIFALLWAAPAFAQCGWTDANTHIPSGYPNTFVYPAVGGSYTDATGCVVTRITNGTLSHNGNGINVEYNCCTALSADNQYVLGFVRGSPNVTTQGPEIYDRQGNIIVKASNVPGNLQELKWAGPSGTGQAHDGHTIYYLSYTTNSSSLYVGTFLDNGCAPNCTVTSTLLHTFAGYGSTGNMNMEFAGGESDVTNGSGNYVLLDDDAGGTAVNPTFFNYNLKTGALSTWDFTSAGTHADGATLLHDDSVIVNWTSSGTCSPTDCYKGIEHYAIDFTFDKQIFPNTGHYTTGWYGANNYVVVMDNNHGVCGGGNGVSIADVATNTKTCIFKAEISPGASLAGSVSSKNGWIITYLQDYNSASYTLSAASTTTGTTTDYTDTFGSKCTSNGCVGWYWEISGFTHSQNNGGPFLTSTSTSTTITVNNPNGIAETHSGTAVWLNTNTYPLSPNWASLWAPNYNELVLIPLSTVADYHTHPYWRVVQTRTCSGAQADYWKEPFGTLSDDATLVAFGSDGCQNSTLDYTDIFVLQLYPNGIQVNGVTLSGLSIQ